MLCTFHLHFRAFHNESYFRASIEEFKDAKVNLSESASSGSCPCFPAIAVIISNKPGVIKDEDLCIHVQLCHFNIFIT